MYHRFESGRSFDDGPGIGDSPHYLPALAGPLPLELQELVSLRGEGASRPVATSEQSDWPVSVYVPEHYEDSYAYPLILWLHDAGGDESDLDFVMPAVSDRNYLGLALRGNCRAADLPGYDWNPDTLLDSETPFSELIYSTVTRLRQAFHIHSERIILAGSGAGADVALQTLIHHPDWFAGAVALDAPCTALGLESKEAQSLEGKPILLSVARDGEDDTLLLNLGTARRLRELGARLSVEVTESALDPASNSARLIDHWLMEHIIQAAFV